MLQRYASLGLCFCLGLGCLGAEPLAPKSTFDLISTLRLLDEGNCVVRGTAYVDNNGHHFPREGEYVVLVPVTPYMEECRALARDNPNQPIQVDPRATSVAYVTRTIDRNGHFLFVNLKPGRYYISVKIDWLAKGTEKVEVGRNQTYNYFGVLLSSTPIYERRDYFYKEARSVETTVEVAAPGQTLDVQLKGD